MKRQSVSLFALVVLTACPQTSQIASVDTPTLIRYDYSEGEITKLCAASIEKAKAVVTSIKALSEKQKKDFDLTQLAFESAIADLNDETSPLTFMGYVSENEKLRDEAMACEESVGQFYPTLSSDKQLYLSLKIARGRNKAEKRLAEQTLISFEKNGMNLSDEKLAELISLKQKLTTLQTEFSENLNNDVSTVIFSKEELKGATETFLNRLKKTEDGRYIVTTKSTDYLQVAENVESSETRKKMLFAYQNRAAEKNTKLLEDAILLRQKIASVLGKKTWAEVQIQGRMAPSSEEVLSFLNGLKAKLSEKSRSDIAKLLAYKKELDPKATEVNIWDLAYLSYGLKKRDYDVDAEKIAEYFPAETVVKGMFEIYSTLLGVNYEKVEDAKVWSKGVNLYKVIDGETRKVLSYFYTDTIPREGKYGHAAAFSLIFGRVKEGKYTLPVSSIVANFTPPAGEKPSLMTHDDVETLFHEFGHIMHQVLTRAPYASLSGTAVAQDFVEAPSQMLENWVWDSEILNRISGHYQTGEKLPTELRNKMIAAKNFNLGYSYTRQLLYGLFDMSIHTTEGAVDVTKVFNDKHAELLGVPAIEGGHFPASFGHMMGGYDAGYYGYLWSEVYAQDMFSKFESSKVGLLDSKVGGEYRQYILQSGNMKDAGDLLKGFLGREPNADAFYKKLGI